ncbi:MAG: methyltransferase domain-containing protein [Polyangiales bacterium]
MTEPNENDPWTDDHLTAGVRIWQRKKGHRYSLDDVLTAHEALAQRPKPRRYLDLGCGIGSVLLSVFEKARPERAVGLEAQDQSFAMVQKNAARNEFDIELFQGDLRDPERRAALGGPFDLITGTPPYAPPGTATPSPDSQRAHARIEYRGGIEAYLEAAAELLAEDGDFVVCAGGDPARVVAGAEGTSLVPHQRLDMVPRAGRGVLFHVWRFRAEPAELRVKSFVARDEAGERTQAYVDLRAFFGLPLPSQVSGGST